MASENELYAKRVELARGYAKTVAEREKRIAEKLQSIVPQGDISGNFTLQNVFYSLFAPAISSGKYTKPSDFFKKEMPWILEDLVPARLQNAFFYIVDHIRDYSCTASLQSRSFRSDNYLHYLQRLGMLLVNFRLYGHLDADICDILTGNLSDETISYFRNKTIQTDMFIPEVLAYALDQEDPRLESIVYEIINGENGFTTVSHSLISGIVMSHNKRMHSALCRLLVAARLQEGLRQAICESADCGTKEAFFAILSTIAENDLIRYSSVKRAVGVWLGLMTEETRDLERVSAKSIELVLRCLKDDDFRAEALNSEDAMQIHISLWSTAFHSVEKAAMVLETVCKEGTHHQVLSAGYYVANLDDVLLQHSAAKVVLSRFPEQWDILAVYLSSFLRFHNIVSYHNAHNVPKKEQQFYFATEREGAEYCDWLIDLYGQMKKKELVFEPCIFPWHKVVLTRSELLEKAMTIAFITKDQGRIERLCPMLPEFGADYRSTYVQLLAQVDQTEPVRKALLAGLCDKSYYTRHEAVKQLREMKLRDDEYLAIEDMLRLRYEDLRSFATELLLKQEDGALCHSIGRLLSASKTEKRTAALDMLLQLRKQKDRVAVAENCLSYVRQIQQPTTQEQILIDQLLPKAAKPEKKQLFTPEDRYVPQIEADAFAMECIREFIHYFPDSKIEKQVLEGKTVVAKMLPKPEPCAAAQKAEKQLLSLSRFFVAHETEHFSTPWQGEMPISCWINHFTEFGNDDPAVPRMDLWERWQAENEVTVDDLVRIFVLMNAQAQKYDYLKRCAVYISDLFGAGFEREYICRYMEHLRRIVCCMLFKQLSRDVRARLAAAVGIWIARCLPEDMLLGCSGKPDSAEVPLPDHIHFADDRMRQAMVLQRKMRSASPGHFIAHPQIANFLYWLDIGRGELQKGLIPIAVCIYDRSFRATDQFMEENYGQKLSRTQATILDHIYGNLDRFLGEYMLPNMGTYLYARNYGLISDAALYCYAMDENNLKSALELTTSVSALYPEDDTQVAHKTIANYHGNRLRYHTEKLFGEDREIDAFDEQMIVLCHRVSKTLVDVVLSEELVRGDSMTQYSRTVTGIQSLCGSEVFVKILSALGKEPLDRATYYYGRIGGTKRENLSYLLAHCAPGASDSAETLAKLLQGTDITKKRLIEAAIYSPDWIDLIGQYLDFNGFKSACYYFMAHMNEQFDDRKKAVIARFTPLTDEELNMGAFDMAWFRSAYAQLGEKDFELIYDAAKYISDGSKHTRARKFADAALGRLDREATEAEIKEKRNKDLVMAYAVIPLRDDADLSHRYFFLQKFLKESRQFGAQRINSEKKAVEAALRNLATNAGFSDTMRLTLRMETQLVEENAELFTDHTVMEWTFRLAVDELGNADVLCFKDGKQLKSLPAKAKKEPYVLQLTDMKKQLNEQYRRTRRMFEQAMEDGAVFSLSELIALAQNPVVKPILTKLVFCNEEQLGFFDGEALVDPDSTVLSANGDAQLCVAHPYNLYISGEWVKFQKYLFDHEIVQPFRQVFRELYVKTTDELGSYRSVRYAGNQIQPQKAAACLKERRWVADVDTGLQKVYYREDIVATIFAIADWFTPADIEAPTLEYVAFYHRKTGEALLIDDIPEVIFSEVMRDVDMAVSVAHAGGVDPETSHSTVEMRAAILGFTLPLLRLQNVSIDSQHALVHGKLARYSIHLGSGVVHQIGGTMLSVLPVHSQHRGRIFLPFVDEDPKTAEIISKVILFAEDHKLKDPTILSQITR